MRAVLARGAPAARSRSAGLLARALSSGEKYDVTILGGGPGGYVAAIKAAQLGLKTACVESRGRLGGTCLNVGCIPSKSLLHSSHLYHEAKHEFATHGIEVGDLSVNLSKMMELKSKTVTGLTGGIEFLFKKYGVDYVKGWGRLSGPQSVNVELLEGGSQTVESDKIVIATGSEPMPLPPCPVDNAGKRIVDSTGALELTEIPKKMVVVGGGVIGLEMGSVWNRLGTEVEVVEFLDRIVPTMDQEIGKQFQRTLKKQGLKFTLKTKVTSSEVTADGVVLTVEPAAGGEAQTISADVVLVATGRRPVTKGIGLEELGIEMDRLGRVQVDEHFQTKVPSVYAIGDCIEGAMLAHKAEEEGIACVEIIAGFAGHVNYDVIPGVVYTMPELASAGKTEEELKEAGVNFAKGTFPFSANSRARCVNQVRASTPTRNPAPPRGAGSALTAQRARSRRGW